MKNSMENMHAVVRVKRVTLIKISQGIFFKSLCRRSCSFQNVPEPVTQTVDKR